MAGSCEGSSRGRSKGGCANVAPDRNDPLGSDARLCDDDLALVLGVDERLHGLRIVVAELGRLFDVDRLAAAALFGKMAERTVSPEQSEDLLGVVFPRTNKKKEPERWSRIKKILEDSQVTPPETKNTLWALYNAIARDEDYRDTRESSPEGRLNRVWFGSGSELKLKAFAASRDFLRVCPGTSCGITELSQH